MRNAFISFMFLTSLFTAFLSCNKEKQYNIHGKVVNKVTGEPIEGALVHLRDAVGSNALIEGPEVNNFDEDYTDVNGDFKVQIVIEDGHGVLSAGKEGYRWVNPFDGSEKVYTGVKEGNTVINLELEGLAFFSPFLIKTSGTSTSNDSLLFDLLSYDDFNSNYKNTFTRVFIGSGPFEFTTLEDGWRVKGDRYLRYKIEYTDGGTWNEKIDSVFLPTSPDAFTDTLTY